jgi:uncharacterized repeat protein (TIGR01451 family)
LLGIAFTGNISVQWTSSVQSQCTPSESKDINYYISNQEVTYQPSDEFWLQNPAILVASKTKIDIWNGNNIISKCNEWSAVSNILPGNNTKALYLQNSNGCTFSKPSYTKENDPNKLDAQIHYSLAYWTLRESNSASVAKSKFSYITKEEYNKGTSKKHTCYPSGNKVSSVSECPETTLKYYKKDNDAEYHNGECLNYRVFRCGDGLINGRNSSTSYNNGTFTEECDPNHPTYKGKGTCSADCKKITLEQPLCSSTYNGKEFDTLTSSNTLCNPGTISNFTTTTVGRTWKCNGLAGTTPAQCSAKKKVTLEQPLCNSAYHGQEFDSLTSSNTLCNPGTISNFTTTNSGRTWKCNGQAGTTPAQCSAKKKVSSPTLWIKKFFSDGTKGPKTYKVGDTVEYRIEFGNDSQTTATIVSLKDFLPQNLKYLSSEIHLNLSQNLKYLSDETYIKQTFNHNTGINQGIFSGTDQRVFTGINQGIFTGTDQRVFTGINQGIFTGTDQRVFTGINQGIFTGTDQRVFTGINQGIFSGTDQRVFTGTDQRVFTGTDQRVFTGTDQRVFTGINQRVFTGTDQRVFTGINQGIFDSLSQNLRYLSFNHSTGIDQGVVVDIWGNMTLPAGVSGYLIVRGEVLSTRTDSTTNIACIYLNDIKVDCDDVSYQLESETSHLIINKTVNKSEVKVGEEVTFTLEVTNDGQTPMTNFTITDTLPNDLTYISQTSNGFTFSTAGRQLIWEHYTATLQPGERISVNFTARVEAIGHHTNYACVTHPDFPTWGPTPYSPENCDPEDVIVKDEQYCEQPSLNTSSTIWVKGTETVSVRVTCRSTDNQPANITLKCNTNSSSISSNNVSSLEYDCQYNLSSREDSRSFYPSCTVNGETHTKNDILCQSPITLRKDE